MVSIRFRSLSVALAAAPALSLAQMSPAPNQVPTVVGHSVLIGPASPTQVLHVSLNFAPPSPSALQAYADSVSDPTNANYRHFLTPAQIGAKFGQPTSMMQSAVSYLQSHGFKITLLDADNLHILADGTVAQAESAFSTQINNYHSTNPKEMERVNYFSYATRPELPTVLAGTVLHIGGLSNYLQPHKGSTLTPGQTRTLYNTLPEFNGGLNGQGRTVAISSFDGFKLSNVPLWYKQYGLPTPPGGVGTNITVETFGGGSGSGAEQGEGDLDMQMVLGQAPLANLIIYDGAGDEGSTTALYTAEQSEDKADVITESYGWGLTSFDSLANAWHGIHVEMSAEGITYMDCAGDFGTQWIQLLPYPDEEPEVLTVGGTSASVDASGNRLSEVAWSLDSFGLGGGGGYVDNDLAWNVLPSWQVASGVPTTINRRLVPDVSLHSSGSQFNDSPAYFFFFGGQLTADSVGTSFACPIFAGSLAVAEQKMISLGGLPPDSNGKQRLGRIQDAFYKQNMRSDVWYDITVGDIGPLPNGTEAVAGKGWDFASGLGAINFDAFVKAVVAKPVTINAATAGIYVDPTLGAEGSGALGTASSLATVDNNDFSVGSVNSNLGQIAAAQVTLNLQSLSKISSVGFTVVVNVPQTVTNFLYAKNWTTGKFDLLSTNGGTGADQTISLQPANIANYYNATTGQVVLVDRGVQPSHVSTSAFRLKLDQVVAVEGVLQ